jgi:hypothetical protein
MHLNTQGLSQREEDTVVFLWGLPMGEGFDSWGAETSALLQKRITEGRSHTIVKKSVLYVLIQRIRHTYSLCAERALSGKIVRHCHHPTRLAP